LKHYARIKDEEFEIMTGSNPSAAKSVTPNAGGHAISLDVASTKPHFRASRKASQHTPARGCNNLQQQSQVPIKTAPCGSGQEATSCTVTPTGFETESVSLYSNSELRHSENFGVPKSVPLLDNPAFHPDDRQSLQTIISLWPGLSAEMKIGILHMIDAASRVHAGAR
jgi:hypothetical protein